MPDHARKTSRPDQSPLPELAAENSAATSTRATVGAVALLIAAWIVSGGCGLIASPFSHALVWPAMALVTIGFGWGNRPDGRHRFIRFAGIVAAVLLVASHHEVINLLGLVVLAAAVAVSRGQSGISRAGAAMARRTADEETESADGRVLRLAAQAVAVLAVYRLAITTIPTAWHLAEIAGSLVGRMAASFWSQPLSVGATYAGLDHLVLMGALIVGWLRETARPRLFRAVLAISAVVAGQALYLLCLSLSTQLAAALPAPPVTEPPRLYVPPAWFWGDGVKSLLPWHLPVLAVLWHAAVAAAIFRSTGWKPADSAPEQSPTLGAAGDAKRRSDKVPSPHPVPPPAAWIAWAPLGLAVLLPIVSVLSFGPSELTGKTVLVFDQGYLDWDVPEHGRYGADEAGRFGMLPAFVESLGGRLVRSTELAEDELAAAEVLMLLHPNQPWSEEMLARVWGFVHSGGSLLVGAGPRFQDQKGASSFNAVLEPLGMPVRFDTTVSRTESWRHAMQTSSHPAALGLRGNRDRFGVTTAASIRPSWRAWPILVGRWGWSDAGSDAMLTGRSRWDAGERLGDLVLAAERRHGAGRVVVLGDTGCLTNLGHVRAYRFTGRLLTYLAGGGASAQAWWRQVLGLLVIGGLVVLLFRNDGPAATVAWAITLAVALLGAEKISSANWEVWPDGRLQSPNNLAYVDASHLDAYSESPWSPEGIDGLALSLMRDGFLVLFADDLSEQRLPRAAMLISVAPAAGFATAERETVKDFVEAGGLLVGMAGAIDGRKINALLQPFGFETSTSYHRPGARAEDAAPVGCIYTSYPETESSRARIVFHAAWPIHLLGQSVQTIARTSENKPVAATATWGRGRVIVIGDTCFAMNKTLENEVGEALVDERIGADFWRWLVGTLPDREPWQPPVHDWSGAGSGDSQGREDAEEVSGMREEVRR